MVITSPEPEAWKIFPTSELEIDDKAPDQAAVTAYDEAHIATYAALLVAEAEGADWSGAAWAILKIDSKREPARALGAWTSHLARAHWLATSGLQGFRSDFVAIGNARSPSCHLGHASSKRRRIRRLARAGIARSGYPHFSRHSAADAASQSRCLPALSSRVGPVFKPFAATRRTFPRSLFVFASQSSGS